MIRLARAPLVLVLGARLAWGAGAPAAEPAAPEDPKVKATAFALPHADVDETAMVEVMRAIEGGLKKNTRLEMKELDTRLADFAQETPSDQIESARAALREGQQAIAAGRAPEGLKKLAEAVAGLAGVLPFIKKQELADAQAALAVACFQKGDRKAGREVFIELLTWRPDYIYDPGKLPPEHGREFDEAQRQVEAAPRRSLAIGSKPAGAQAYVDGKYIGVTPCTADAQPVGKHYVTLKKEGYKKAVAPVVIRRTGDPQVEIAIERSEKYLIVEQARTRIEGVLGQDKIGAEEADNLRAVLFVEHAVFVKATPAAPGQIQVEAWLYDLRTRQRLSQVRQTVARGAIEHQMAALPQALYANVNYEGELVAPPEAPPPPSRVKAWYASWWFWTAIGAGVVVAGGAVATYYGIVAAQGPQCPDTARCFSFQP